jgi:hypothetical protein
VRRVEEIVRALRESGHAILLVEQNLALALSVADRIHVISSGRFVFDGTPDRLNRNAAVLDSRSRRGGRAGALIADALAPLFRATIRVQVRVASTKPIRLACNVRSCTGDQLPCDLKAVAAGKAPRRTSSVEGRHHPFGSRRGSIYLIRRNASAFRRRGGHCQLANRSR